jgi:hypothetical protein
MGNRAEENDERASSDILRKLDEALESKVVAIETVDHPSNGQTIAHGKKYLRLGPDRIRVTASRGNALTGWRSAPARAKG